MLGNEKERRAAISFCLNNSFDNTQVFDEQIIEP